MNILRFLFSFTLYGNIWIAAGATMLAWEWYFVNEDVPDLYVLIFVFSSAFAQYNLQRLVMIKPHDPLVSVRQKWIIEQGSFLTGLIIIFASLSLICFFRLTFWQQAISILTAVLSFFYFYPHGGLRSLPYAKAFLIALSWTLVTAFLPASVNGIQYPGWLAGEHFIFIISLCFLFDIRDLKADREAKVKTFPVQFGTFTTKVISVVLLGASACMLIRHYGFHPVLFAYLPALILAAFASEKRKEWYFAALIDGLIILRPLLLLI